MLIRISIFRGAVCRCCLNSTKKPPRKFPEGFHHGGEREIRTLGTGLPHTRFPVVRLRPAQPSLRADLDIILLFSSLVKSFLKFFYFFVHFLFFRAVGAVRRRFFRFFAVFVCFFVNIGLIGNEIFAVCRHLSNDFPVFAWRNFKKLYTKTDFYVTI